MLQQTIILLDQPVGPRYSDDESCFFWGQAPAFTSYRAANEYVIEVPQLCLSYINEKSDTIVNLCKSARESGHSIAVIAGSEAGVELAGELREEFSLTGGKSSSTCYFRDKLKMYQLALDLLKDQSGSLGVIPTYTVTRGNIKKMHFSSSSPIVLKPRNASGSMGIKIAQKTGDLDKIDARYSYIAQPFIAGNILHVDGFYLNGSTAFTTSQYLAPPEAWTSQKNLYASYTVDMSPLCHKHIQDFIVRYCAAAEVDRTPFHLELIESGSNMYFLEMGARLGGGPIRDALSALCKQDMNDATIALYTDPHFKLPDFDQAYAGWMLVSDAYADQDSLKNFQSMVAKTSHFVDVRYGGASGDPDAKRFGLALRAIVCSGSEAEIVDSFMHLCAMIEKKSDDFKWSDDQE